MLCGLCDYCLLVGLCCLVTCVWGCLGCFVVVLWLKQLVVCLCGFADAWCSVLLWFVLWLGVDGGLISL